MKFLIKRDVFLIMLGTFIICWLGAFIPFSISKINPLQNAVVDFELTDICFSKFHKSKTAGFDNRIVIVNVGHEDRQEIAAMLKVLESYSPKIIGIDVLYGGAKGPEADSALKAQLQQHDNIIMGSYLNRVGKDFDEQTGYFATKDSMRGFVNLVGADIGTIRYFSPKEKKGSYTFYNFACLLAKAFDSVAFNKLEKRNNNTETINYRRKQNEFLIVDHDDLLSGNVNGDFIRNKIVLMGYIGSGPFDTEDMNYTPFNERFAGKSLPDMNGVLIHANTITTILDGAYINKMPGWLNWLFILLITWLHVGFFVEMSLRKSGPLKHLFIKTIQFFTLLFLVWGNIILFDNYDLSVNIGTLFIIFAVDVDLIIFYSALVKWLHKKYGFATAYQ